jgi:signal transduction histidine kinase
LPPDPWSRSQKEKLVDDDPLLIKSLGEALAYCSASGRNDKLALQNSPMRMPTEPLVRILIVDDEVAQMKALCNTLRDQGYETMGFTSGKAALATLRDSKFDLLLTDLMMPEMDGISLLRSARESDSELVGIVMTGQGTIDSAVEAMKAGALDYVLKPFRLSVILPVISRALAMRQLRRENLALEKRVRERTAELEAANHELEAFSYSVSHDLRAPLRAVDGYASIITGRYGDQIPAEARRLLETITDRAHFMGRLIDDLLRLSQLSRQPLTNSTISMVALANEVLLELEGERAGRQVEVRIAELPDCVGDRALLKQVLVNLLSNAFKFTGKTAQAVVELDSQQQSDATVYFVRDNGAGFDMKYSQRLFGVFQRMHRTDEFEGTGVGLSIVQRIIQRHGGRIWAEAALEKGATFYFSLPRPVGEK